MTKANLKALGMAASLFAFYLVLEWIGAGP